MFKVILRSFGALQTFQIFDHLISRKRLLIERNGPKFGLWGKVISMYKVNLTIKVFNAIPRSFPNVTFRFSRIMYLVVVPWGQVLCVYSFLNCYGYMGYLWRCGVLVPFEVVRCNFLTLARNYKTAGRRERTEVWDSGTLVPHTWGTFDLVPFNGIFGVFSSAWLCQQS